MQISKQNDEQTNKILRSQLRQATPAKDRQKGQAVEWRGDCDLGQPNALT